MDFKDLSLRVQEVTCMVKEVLWLLVDHAIESISMKFHRVGNKIVIL